MLIRVVLIKKACIYVTNDVGHMLGEEKLFEFEVMKGTHEICKHRRFLNVHLINASLPV